MKIAAIVLGVVTALLGLGLLGGGVWLATLGGSPFYLVAGLLLSGAGIGLMRGKAYGLWLALSTLAIAAVWALWEVGMDFWQLVPRLLVFLGIAMVFAALAPWMKRRSGAAALN